MDIAASVAAVVDKARTSWLKNAEVLELLEGFAGAGLAVCQEPPVRPAGGQLFLFDRRICRFFRRDGHTWRKKPDGKTIRETHEKLKVGNAETLNCYYAHADQEDGLQRRCYWQLDPEKEHIVLVHYLCCASSRAGTQRAASAELAGDVAAGCTPRPQRASRQQHRRAYSPPPGAASAAGGRRRGASQTKLSPLATAASLESDLVSQGSGETELPLVQGMTLEAAAALPSLAQQYAMQQQAAAVVQQQMQLQQLLQSGGSGGSGSGSGEFDPFALPAVPEHHRPLPGVLYTDQRVATQLSAAAAAQQASVHSPLLPPRPLMKQESFQADQHKALFREMSLGIQREATEEGGYFLGSPGEPDPLGTDKAAASTPGPDLAALLASPPHGGHRRSFSRQGSGLSRLISKNWENDVMEMMLPDVDSDISAYPMERVVVEVAQRPSSPGSRLFDQAGIAFFGSAHSAATAVQHALEPSPLGVPGLAPADEAAAATGGGGGAAAAARHLPFASPAQLAPGGESPLEFAAGEAHARAQRPRLARVSGAGMPRSGSHPHLAHLAKRPGGAGAEAGSEEERRKERVDAAAVAAAYAAQEHRDEKLAAVRSQRAASSTEAEDTLEMIDVPENLQRLSSFLHRGPASGARLTLGRELAAAEASAVADLELEARSLLKHMSIDEVDAVAAVRDAAKELEVMPTIYAAPSSELEAASGAPSHRDSQSEELGSRGHSATSLLDGLQVATSGVAGQPLDPIAQQLQAAMAQHAARQAR